MTNPVEQKKGKKKTKSQKEGGGERVEEFNMFTILESRSLHEKQDYTFLEENVTKQTNQE